MARIPTYDSRFDRQGVNAGTPMQSASVLPGAFGMQQAKALTEGGQLVQKASFAVMEVARRMQIEQNDAKATEAYIALNDAMTPFLHGETGVYGQLGGNALDATKRTKDQLNASIGEIESRLENEEQRAMFRRKAEDYRIQTMTGVSRHEAQQRREWLAGTKEAEVKTETDSIAQNYTDQEAIDGSLTRMEASIRDYARIKGLSPEATDALIRDKQSAALVGAAQRHIDAGSFDAARGLLDDPRLSGEGQKAIQRALAPAERLAKTDATVEGMMRQVKAGADRGALLDGLKSIEDPQLRNSIKAAFKGEYAAWKAELREGELDAINNALTAYDALDNYKDRWKLVQSQSDEKLKTRLMAKLNADAQFAGLNAKSDPDAYLRLLDKIENADLTDERQLLADEDADRLVDGDRKKLLNELKGVSTIKEADLRKAFMFATGKGGQPDTKLTKAEKDSFLAFSKWAAGQVKDTNRAKDPEYAQILADTWVLKGETKGRGPALMALGYGKDMEFGKALGDPTWLPDLEGDSKAAVQSKFKSNPALASAWKAQYNGDADLAMRGYYRSVIEQRIGKKPKPVVGEQ